MWHVINRLCQCYSYSNNYSKYTCSFWNILNFSRILIEIRSSCHAKAIKRETLVQGDMGWKLAPQWVAVTRHWCWLINMEIGRLNKQYSCGLLDCLVVHAKTGAVESNSFTQRLDCNIWKPLIYQSCLLQL